MCLGATLGLGKNSVFYFFQYFFKDGFSILKSLLNSLQYCFWVFFFMVFYFLAIRHVGILAPQPGIKPSPSALESKVLTTGPPGKSLERSILESYQTQA